MTTPAITAAADFGPSNPFYAPSKLPYQSIPFDKIKDTDYQPAIEAGMAEQLKEVQAIANNPAPPTFDNTLVALEESGQLLTRAASAFFAVAGANTNPTLLKIRSEVAPKLAAHRDAVFLDPKLFQRVNALYQQRDSLKLDPESQRLLKYYYDEFVHAGANLSEADKTQLKKLNEELAGLSDTFESKLLAATKDGAFEAKDKAALAGLSDAQITAAAEAAKGRKVEGYVVPLQNTTQQPDLSSLTNRGTRETIFNNSWNRTERDNANDTRDTIAKMAQRRAQAAKLLGFPNYAAWKLEDQMAKTPENALEFMGKIGPAAAARAATEAKDIQTVIDQQKGGFQLQPWDWEIYSEQVRKAKYDLDEEQVKPYFEMNNVLENGVFYAANQLYGITFKERKDLPVYDSDMRVFEVFNADGSSLALFYTDYYKRDNKQGGAWMNNFVEQSKLMGTKPVVVNVANFSKPAPGEPALLTSDDVRTMFHEFGHGLHGMFADTKYPSLSGTSTARDFVEFPSQFNEYWGEYPTVFQHYARHYKTGAPMPPELVEKIKKSRTFNKGYDMTELVAAAELDMNWHVLPATAPLQKPDEFEKSVLEKDKLWISYVPPRYRSSYFSHIWGSGYAAGYYAYLWTQMLADDAYQWFVDNGGLTRANGDRFRQMVLSQGNTQDLETLYVKWRGGKPTIGPMLKYRGLEAETSSK
ncbi:MAG TPA: peptidyl-dipeptidase Dcp [Candidatus Methylomirabilis sp.]|nr:peptidyl-dipeptidase Dcp [Candidatus Methylomirabilis sp.]